MIIEIEEERLSKAERRMWREKIRKLDASQRAAARAEIEENLHEGSFWTPLGQFLRGTGRAVMIQFSENKFSDLCVVAGGWLYFALLTLWLPAVLFRGIAQATVPVPVGAVAIAGVIVAQAWVMVLLLARLVGVISATAIIRAWPNTLLEDLDDTCEIQSPSMCGGGCGLMVCEKTFKASRWTPWGQFLQGRKDVADGSKPAWPEIKNLKGETVFLFGSVTFLILLANFDGSGGFARIAQDRPAVVWEALVVIVVSAAAVAWAVTLLLSRLVGLIFGAVKIMFRPDVVSTNLRAPHE